MSDAVEYTVSVILTLMIVALMLVAIWIVIDVLKFWWFRLERNRRIRAQRREQYLRSFDPRPDPSEGDGADPRSAQGR